jgi:hypothetical protein
MRLPKNMFLVTIDQNNGHSIGPTHQILEEGAVVLDLLVEDGCGLLVELLRHVVRVDQGLALVQPLADLNPML